MNKNKPKMYQEVKWFNTFKEFSKIHQRKEKKLKKEIMPF